MVYQYYRKTSNMLGRFHMTLSDWSIWITESMLWNSRYLYKSYESHLLVTVMEDIWVFLESDNI